MAQEEARLLCHNYIGPEHLLIACLHEGEGVAAQALSRVLASGENPSDHIGLIRNYIEMFVGKGQRSPSGHIPFTPQAKKAIETSLREALQLGHNYIGTEHLLLGLNRLADSEPESVVNQIFRETRIDYKDLRSNVIELLTLNAPPRQTIQPESERPVAEPSVVEALTREYESRIRKLPMADGLSVEVVEQWHTDDVAGVRLAVHHNGSHFFIEGSAKRDPHDKPNATIGLMVATSRAMDRLAAKLRKQAMGAVKHADDVRDSRRKSLTKKKKRAALAKARAAKAAKRKANGG